MTLPYHLFILIVAAMSIAAGYSSQETSAAPIPIMRIRNAETPYKGFILLSEGPNITFETCAGNILQVDISNLSYEGDFGVIECKVLAARHGAAK